MPSESEIHRVEFISADAEYGFVADKISELIRSGVPQSEIAVISYKTKYFEPLLPYLKAHEEIKIAYEKRDNLFEDEKIHQILTLSRFIYEIASSKPITSPVMEILTYQFLGLPVVEVIRLVEKAKRNKHSIFDEISACENAAIKEVGEWISDLVVKSFNEPLDSILGCLFSKIDTLSMSEYERFRFYENLASLKGKLIQHFGDKSLKLVDLIELVDDYTEAGMALNATSPYRDADEAVQILTAHKAKGLEFEYVFIISTDHTAWGKGKGNNNLLALPKNLAQIRHTGTTDGEKLRILYVALTRAKRVLYITNSLHDFNNKSPERLEYLEEYVDGDDVISPFLPSKKVETAYDVAPPDIKERNLKNWLFNYITDSPDMRAIYRERMANFKMSASALTTFIDIAYAGPEVFFKRYILQAPMEPETEALAMGDLIHKTYEAVTNLNISDEEALEFYVKELEKKDLPVNVSSSVREKGLASLNVSLKAFGNILRSGKAEVDFSAEKIAVSGVPITGKIDHIAIDEKSKTIEIYDFKTGGYHKEKWQSHMTLYKYMLQLGFYKLLLNYSPLYNKYNVTRAHILFVSPDNDGQVYDKPYDFSGEEETELIAIMKAIYNMTSSLKFLDCSDIMIPPDKTLGIKDIKAFIKLMLAKY